MSAGLPKGPEPRRVVGREKQRAARAQQADGLGNRALRGRDPGKQADGDDQLERAAAAREMLGIGDLDVGVLLQPARGEELAGTIDHGGTGIDRLDREAALRQGGGQPTRSAADLLYPCARWEAKLVDPGEHLLFAFPVDLSRERVIQVDVPPP